jgi:hypothetical protein
MNRHPTRGRLAFTASCAIALSFGALTPVRAKDCVRESEGVRVSGQVQRQSMTYVVGARTQRGTVVTMTLQSPLCVMLPDDVSLAMRPQRIKEVQLLHPERLPTGRDGGILIDGRVTLASSNAHHLPVLVDIQGIPTGRNSAPAATRSTTAQPPSSANTTLAVARVPH